MVIRAYMARIFEKQINAVTTGFLEHLGVALGLLPRDFTTKGRSAAKGAATEAATGAYGSTR